MTSLEDALRRTRASGRTALVPYLMAGAAGNELEPGTTVLINLSGRGDKDVAQVRALMRGER